MNLKEKKFKISYRSDVDNLLLDFYLPAISSSVEYYRATGFFSTMVLNNLGKAIYPFIKNEGKMKLICGVHLSENDITEINNGYKLKEKITEKLIKEIEKIDINYLTTELSNICWMIANDRLEIKIAIKNNSNKLWGGIYHEKISIFKDNVGNILATNGSSNETENGYKYNFEYFDVFKSWGSPEEILRVYEKVDYFKQMWDNKTKNLLVLKFPDAVSSRIINIAPKEPHQSLIKLSKGSSTKISLIKPRKYQIEAVRKWLQNNCIGIFEMATGTGKTYTSLFAVQEYINYFKTGRELLIICCPYQHLVDQWENSLKHVFGDIEIVKCYESKAKWYKELNMLLQNIILGNKEFGIVITTTHTGSSDSFILSVNTEKINKIVICDEVHNIGAEHNKNFLRIASCAKLGLSATPIRPFDEEGNATIQKYFGESIYKLGIQEAIKMGFLVEYNYHLLICNLNEEEYQKYKELSIKIAKMYIKKELVNEEKLQYLLLKRAKILSMCEEKLVHLDTILSSIDNRKNMLVYTAENPEYFKKTLEILNKNKIKTLKITFDIKNNDRREIIEKLENEDIDCILAMRCLDEGVDIPTANKAIILASSTNYKQYIQRRGRVLRKDKAGKKKVADIFDFLVLPPTFDSVIDESMYEREIRRILEFASTSKNKVDILSFLIKFSKENSLMKKFIKVLKEYEI